MSLINKKAVKKFTLDAANIRFAKKLPKLMTDSQGREWNLSRCGQSKKFTQVSKSFMDDVEARVRNMITEHIKKHPSVGKTIR
jgi:hypothetical protein